MGATGRVISSKYVESRFRVKFEWIKTRPVVIGLDIGWTRHWWMPFLAHNILYFSMNVGWFFDDPGNHWLGYL
jgi:hypothetical protein